jgi:hypothetical protein
MSVKRRQGSADQLDLFDQALRASLRLGATGEGGTGPGACAEPQALAAFEQQRALTRMVMEEIASSANNAGLVSLQSPPPISFCSAFHLTPRN